MQDNTTTPRRKLSDILANGDAGNLRQQWQATEAAQDFALLPAGTYTAHVHAVDLFNAKTGTAGVKIQFRIAEGEHVGRMLFDDLWLTPAALPQTKRDCIKLGLDTPDKLEAANVEPGRIRCKVRVTLRTDDNAEQRNRVRGFDVITIDEPERDAFAPSDVDALAGSDTTEHIAKAAESAGQTTEATNGNGELDTGSDIESACDTSFNTGQLDAELAADRAVSTAGPAEQSTATGAAGDDGQPVASSAVSGR